MDPGLLEPLYLVFGFSLTVMNKLIAAYVFVMVNAMELRGTDEILRHIKSSLEFMYVHICI